MYMYTVMQFDWLSLGSWVYKTLSITDFTPLQHNQLLAQQLAFVNLFCHSSTSFILSPFPVHEHGLQQHEKARKLHWTLYGWASLAHRGLKLLVSTVQMIILLQFNNAEVRSGCKGQGAKVRRTLRVYGLYILYYSLACIVNWNVMIPDCTPFNKLHVYKTR